MLELRPCPSCARHVKVGEAACPFCAVILPPGVARHVVLGGRATRAAVFGAALAAGACSRTTDEAAKPAPTQPARGSDDLEKLLDDPYAAGREATPNPPTDATPDATAVAAAIDAAVPLDAGVDEVTRREAERHRKEVERRKRVEDERRRLEQERLLEIERQQDLNRHVAKPYGAPPARRRLV